MRITSRSIQILTLATLLAGATGCSSSHPILGQMLGFRSAIHDTSPLISDRVEMTAYDPHHHIAQPRVESISPRLLQTAQTSVQASFRTPAAQQYRR
jgi:hypothetical protein